LFKKEDMMKSLSEKSGSKNRLWIYYRFCVFIRIKYCKLKTQKWLIFFNR